MISIDIQRDDPTPPAAFEPDEAPAPIVRTPADEFAWWLRARPSFVATYLLGTPGYARWMAVHAPGDRATALLRHDDGASGVGGRIARKGMRFVRRVSTALETMFDLEAVAAFPEDVPLIAALRTGVLEASEGAEWSAVAGPVQPVVENHVPASQEPAGESIDAPPAPVAVEPVAPAQKRRFKPSPESRATSARRGAEKRWEKVRAERLAKGDEG